MSRTTCKRVFCTGVGLVWLTVLAGGIYGCEKSAMWGRKPVEVEVDQSALAAEREAKRSAPLDGTIGAACMFEGLRPVMVEGYGLLGRLRGTGSSDCPAPLRAEMVKKIKLLKEDAKRLKRKRTLAWGTAGTIIASPNTAIVRVWGRIPAGAVKGDFFDVHVEAIAGSDTTSLEGGWLYSFSLYLAGGRGSSFGRSREYARAAGQVFVNPFKKAVRPERRSAEVRRNGTIPGGAVVKVSRSQSLALNQPSYETARRIQEKINGKFGGGQGNIRKRAANAKNQRTVTIRIPESYLDRQSRFISLVRNLYIRTDPTYLDMKARELRTKILEDDSNAEAISYAWETMGGTTVLPLIQDLYNGSNVRAAFWSARVGAVLGDRSAIDRLGRFALMDGPYQIRALSELGYCKTAKSREILRKSLGSTDVDVRILAYDGLARQRDKSVRRYVVGEGNFRLDVVAGGKLPLIYATRTTRAKIVLFAATRIETPVFYTHWDDSIMLTADTDDQALKIMLKLPDGEMTDPIEGSLNLLSLLQFLGSPLTEIDNELQGLGQPYSKIVGVLKGLCDDGSIPGRFKLEDVGPRMDVQDYSTGRPERDE